MSGLALIGLPVYNGRNAGFVLGPGHGVFLGTRSIHSYRIGYGLQARNLIIYAVGASC